MRKCWIIMSAMWTPVCHWLHSTRTTPHKICFRPKYFDDFWFAPTRHGGCFQFVSHSLHSALYCLSLFLISSERSCSSSSELYSRDTIIVPRCCKSKIIASTQKNWVKKYVVWTRRRGWMTCWNSHGTHDNYALSHEAYVYSTIRMWSWCSSHFWECIKCDRIRLSSEYES